VTTTNRVENRDTTAVERGISSLPTTDYGSTA